jgi:hypothetical protein
MPPRRIGPKLFQGATISLEEEKGCYVAPMSNYVPWRANVSKILYDCNFLYEF